MSVLSAVAEEAGLLEAVSSEEMRTALRPMTGKFKVLRVELGAVQHSLQRIFLEGDAIIPGLTALGVHPVLDTTKVYANNRPHFESIMVAFHARYPDHGLLIVIDELLDFLRGRDNVQLTHDFNFLRELAEYAQGSRLRLIAGVQEALLGNQRFQVAADAARRVMERFHSLTIKREDIEYVVQERLLRKTPEQAQWVRGHLGKFQKLYTALATDFERHVHLYPFHPKYIERFSQLQMGERREILTTLSRQLAGLQDQAVPDHQPGLVSYDSYWELIEQDAVYDREEGVRAVKPPLQTLKSKLPQLPAPYQPGAKRILNALAVHRLTTPNLTDSIGLNVVELRDELMLAPTTQAASQQLLDGTITATVQKLREVVGFQFISSAKINNLDSFYLDLEKIEPIDENVESQAAHVATPELEGAYYELFRQLLSLDVRASYVANYNIWEWRLDWKGRNTDRLGYVFFGLPDDRSTAQPPREFYTYICPPGREPRDAQEDEVFFLCEADPELEGHLRRHVSARMWAATKGAHAELARAYTGRAKKHLEEAYTRLRDRVNDAFKVAYGGTTLAINTFCARNGVPTSFDSLGDMVRTVASAALGPRFDQQHPDYPRFDRISPAAQYPELLRKGLAMLAKGSGDEQGQRFLRALDQLDGNGHLKSTPGRYAQHFLGLLEAKRGQVVNRGEVMEQYAEGKQGPEERDAHFHLEPPLMAGVLASLVAMGKIQLRTRGKPIAADGLETFTPDDFLGFDLFGPVSAAGGVLPRLATLYGAPTILAQNQDRHQELLARLLSGSDELQKRAVPLLSQIEPRYWGEALVSQQVLTEHRQQLEALRKLNDRVLSIKNVGQLRALQLADADVDAAEGGLQALADVEALNGFLKNAQPLTDYLQDVLLNVPTAPETMRERIRDTKARQVRELQQPGTWPRPLPDGISQLQGLRDEYIAWYRGEFQRYHLSASQEAEAKELRASSIVEKLRNLKVLPVISGSEFGALENRLDRLRFAPLPADAQFLQSARVGGWAPPEPGTPLPADELAGIEAGFSDLLQAWVGQIRANLDDPTVVGNIELLQRKDRDNVELFRRDPEGHINPPVITSLGRAFDKLQPVTITAGELALALSAGGPADPAEMRQRFDALLKSKMSTLNPKEVRLIIQ